MGLSDQSTDQASAGRRNTLIDAAYTHLAGTGTPAGAQELARQALRLDGPPPPSLVSGILELIEADPRFRRTADGLIGLDQWGRDDVSIEAAEFVVFDIESNGGRSGRHRIIELGAVKTRAGEVTAEFQSLVGLRRRLPSFVTQLTGIQAEMLEGAPGVETVLADFARFAAGAVLVAHNLPADLAYLNHEAIWAGLPLFPSDGLDTMELASTLIPQLRQPSLAGALAHFGRPEPTVHRALPDARSAAALFWRLARLAQTEGARTVRDLRRLPAPAGGGLPRRRAELARWSSLNLPALPGVYVFRDAEGRALYVGKSKSLQRRVRSHFSGPGGYVQKWQGLFEAAAAIDHEVTGSEFSALLREIELIAQFKPPYNTQLARKPAARIVRLGPPDDPVVGCVSAIAADGAQYCGPFRTAVAAHSTAAATRRIFHLPSRLRRIQVESPLNRAAAGIFLSAGRDTALEYLNAVSAGGDPIAEGMARGLRRIRRLHQPIAGGLAGARAIYFDHGPRPGEIEFFVIDQGAVSARRRVDEPARQDVRAILRDVLDCAGPPQPSDPNSVNLVLAWLHQKFGDQRLVVVGPEMKPQRIFAIVWRQVSLLARY